MNIGEIKELMKTMKENNIKIFKYNGEGVKFEIKSNDKFELEDKSIEKIKDYKKVNNVKEVNDDKKFEYIKSPIVGTFYGKPGPDKDFFVKKGDVVKKGSVLCIVEAMKVMNEITAAEDMKILEIMIADEEIVEYGQNLFAFELV